MTSESHFLGYASCLFSFIRFGNGVGVLSIQDGPPGDDIFGFAGIAEATHEPPFIVSRRHRAAGMFF